MRYRRSMRYRYNSTLTEDIFPFPHKKHAGQSKLAELYTKVVTEATMMTQKEGSSIRPSTSASA